MSYEKFITDFLNIEPQRLQKCISSTREDGEITVRIRLKPQSVKAVTTKFDIAKLQKRDSDDHINGKALTINFDRYPNLFIF